MHTSEWHLFVNPLDGVTSEPLVTRLKFELGTAIGIVIADIGLMMLWLDGFASCKLSLSLLVLSVIIAVYLGLWEAPGKSQTACDRQK